MARSGLLELAGLLLLAEFALAVLPTFSGRVVSLVDSLLVRARHQRLERAADGARRRRSTSRISRTAEFQDQLERARRQTSGRMTLMGQLFGQAQDIVTVVELCRRARLLRALADRAAAVWRWCRPSSARRISTRKAIRSIIAARPERRELDYVRQTAASVETAKEVKIFGLNGFLIDRYMRLATRLLRGQSHGSRCGARAGAACSPRSARSATIWPMPTSPGAR